MSIKNGQYGSSSSATFDLLHPVQSTAKDGFDFEIPGRTKYNFLLLLHIVNNDDSLLSIQML